MFPFHLRLSIHAHKNCGPKFGIQLLASEDCFVINSIDDYQTPRLDDVLHIPTPWHNSIVKINEKKLFYVTKSGSIKKSILEGKGTGGWNSFKSYFEFICN
jgi:pyoverdine/dityrosine biosynthesis protein Dit1